MCIYIIGMPIGNMKDITLRALETFKDVTEIYAEDTRSFKIFAKYHSIFIKHIYSYEDYNERNKSIEIINKLKNDPHMKIAIVAEAGTPLISDPGFHVVKLAHENNIKIEVIPGPSSLTSCLSIAPFNGSNFTFLGFFYDYKIKEVYAATNTVVFFDTAKRLMKNLHLLQTHFSDAYIFIGRELTKKFETHYYFPIKEIPLITLQGEFVVIIEKNYNKNEQIDDNMLINIKNNFPHIHKKDLAKIIHSITNISVNDIYKKLIHLKDMV